MKDELFIKREQKALKRKGATEKQAKFIVEEAMDREKNGGISYAGCRDSLLEFAWSLNKPIIG